MQTVGIVLHCVKFVDGIQMPNADPHQFPTARPPGGFGTDEVPSGHGALYAYFEILAFALVCGAADAMLSGKLWYVWLPAFACGTLFFLVGIKSPWIRSKFVSVDWVLWNKRIDRALRVALAVALVSVMASSYFLYRETALLWRNVFGNTQSDSKRQTPEPPGAQATPELPNAAAAPKSLQRLPPLRTGRVDWHDKHNWRGNLRIGMAETEVNRLFGEPDQIQVIKDMEIWHYGYGEVTFTDGTLYSWDEPE